MDDVAKWIRSAELAQRCEGNANLHSLPAELHLRAQWLGLQHRAEAFAGTVVARLHARWDADPRTMYGDLARMCEGC